MSVSAAHNPTQIYISDRVQVTDRSGMATRDFHKIQLALVQNVNTQPDVLAISNAQRRSLDVSIYPEGSLVYVVDRQVTYVLIGSDWLYASGYMRDVKANVPTDLGPHDEGFLMYVEDYHHLVMWGGSFWQFGPGDDGSAYFRDMVRAATPPVGWAPCDGSATNYLIPGATLESVAFMTPNLTGSPAYRKSGAAYSDAIVTGGGTLTGGGASDPSHITVLPYFRR